MSTTFHCTTAQLITPEFLRLYARATLKENRRQQLIKIARYALRLCGLLKPSESKVRNTRRVMVALNKLRAA